MFYHFFSKVNPSRSEVASQVRAYVLETTAALSEKELTNVRWTLRIAWDPQNLHMRLTPHMQPDFFVGPQQNFATSHSTNKVSALHGIGIKKAMRLETFEGYTLKKKVSRQKFFDTYHDEMTERIYGKLPKILAADHVPEPVRFIPLLEKGITALEIENKNLGLAMDKEDVDVVNNIFTSLKRNPTDVELFSIAQGNSEHCRHHWFRGKIVINGNLMEHTLFDLIKAPWKKSGKRSIIAFHDNSSALRGGEVRFVLPKYPDKPSRIIFVEDVLHPILTVETHNHPTGVAPYPGAATGIGGCLRDIFGTGRGATPLLSITMYAVASLDFPDYEIAGELRGSQTPSNLAPAKKILIEGSHGVAEYGNPFGVPNIVGSVRTFDQILPSGERIGYHKPILMSGHAGMIRDGHTKKARLKKGMKVVMIGGPAYRIGVGGGAASSMTLGQNKQTLDLNSVQRGDPQMEQKVRRVIDACISMGKRNPILSIHDQGAGGPGNVLSELVHPAGAKIDLAKINRGDNTLSAREIWSAEYQERMALLISPKQLQLFKKICAREKCPCEVLGTITGNKKIVVTDAEKEKVVDLVLEKFLGEVPQKTFSDVWTNRQLEYFSMPEDTIAEMIRKVFSLPSVGSKRHLTEIKDRAVTGLVRLQQHVGRQQLPISNAGVVALSLFDQKGIAVALGEKPIVGLVDDGAGARMTNAEMLKNIGCCVIRGGFSGISMSKNEMLAIKSPGELARLYNQLTTGSDFEIATNIITDGGKDSTSLGAKIEEEMVKAPLTLVATGYGAMENSMKYLTPDIKHPGKSKLLLIDDTPGNNRLGGSAFVQAYGQIGSIAPDIDDIHLFVKNWNMVQSLIKKGLVHSYHDTIGDGGLITAVAEMAMASDCGIHLDLSSMKGNTKEKLFTEESRVVLEYLPEDEDIIFRMLEDEKVPYHFIGTTQFDRSLLISDSNKKLYPAISIAQLREWWEATSNRINQEQRTKVCVDSHKKIMHGMRDTISYNPRFNWWDTKEMKLRESEKPRALVLREEGSNSDGEYIAALMHAGFHVTSAMTDDLLKGKFSLEQFQFLGPCGGFSYADDLGSGRAWAAKFMLHQKLNKMLKNFLLRPNTLSLHPCNAAQMFTECELLVPNLRSEDMPRLIKNKSDRFESRWSMVKIPRDVRSVLFRGMEDSIVGMHVDHAEGRWHFPRPDIIKYLILDGLVPFYYVDERHEITEEYPFNPNGSICGIAGLSTPDGRHTVCMPHPERSFLLSQWPYVPNGWKDTYHSYPHGYSPCFRIFQNAFEWCYNHR